MGANKLDKVINPLTQSAPIQNAQPAAENPLDKLKDIHLPEQIDAFPNAPGWWLLLAIIVSLVLFFVYRRYQYKQSIRLLIPAKKELSQLRILTEEQIGATSIAALSALLKRICLIYFPSNVVASLSGKNWLTFLNQQHPSSSSEHSVFFSPNNIELFTNAPYQVNPIITLDDWATLVDASERCIESIIITAAKQKKHNNKKNSVPLPSKKTTRETAI